MGLDDKERAAIKQTKTIRSRSPTLRKTETQDIYRTFLEVPEGLGAYYEREVIATPKGEASLINYAQKTE